jgi:aspartate/glutamate racemase
MKVIGILGGLGPEAPADLYLKPIHRSYRRAGQDMHGYPHIWINNIPCQTSLNSASARSAPIWGNRRGCNWPQKLDHVPRWET